MASANRLAASERAVAETSRELALITEMSREITSTLDLDRVLRTVVNLASKALKFDRGAIALYEHGVCDIRAVAGADGVDREGYRAPGPRRARRLGRRPRRVVLPLRAHRSGLRRRAHVRPDLRRRSRARRRDERALSARSRTRRGSSASCCSRRRAPTSPPPRERDLAAILANQSTVAVRNARLYRQVPLASAIGAISAKKAAWFELPRQRRRIYVGAAVVALAALTLIRWPMRVPASIRCSARSARADVRSMLPGLIDRVFVREGMIVERGAPVAHLRDDERRAEREASLAAVAASRARRGRRGVARRRGRGAAPAPPRRRAAPRRRRCSTSRSARASCARPSAASILTARPEERVGSHADAGDLLAVVGRTDSLELEFGVERARHHARAARRRGAAAHRRDAAAHFGGRVTLDRCDCRRPRRRSVVVPRARRGGEPGRAAAAGDGGPRARAHRARIGALANSRALRCAPRASPGGDSGHDEQLELLAARASPSPRRRARLGVQRRGAIGDGAAGRRAGGPPAAAAEFTVDTATVRLPLELPAQLYVEHDAVVVARSAGTIDGLYAELGDRVSAGQLLARLESTDQEIALAGAEAAYESMTRTAARTRLLKQGGGATAADSEQVEFQLRQADVQRRKAQRDVELTRVVAPFAGVVTARLARPRRFVEVGTRSSASPSRRRCSRACACPRRGRVSCASATRPRSRPAPGSTTRRGSSTPRRSSIAGSGTREVVLQVDPPRRRAARRQQRDRATRPRAAARRHRAARGDRVGRLCRRRRQWPQHVAPGHRRPRRRQRTRRDPERPRVGRAARAAAALIA